MSDLNIYDNFDGNTGKKKGDYCFCWAMGNKFFNCEEIIKRYDYENEYKPKLPDVCPAFDLSKLMLRAAEDGFFKSFGHDD